MPVSNANCCQPDTDADLSAALNADCSCTSTTTEALGLAVMEMANDQPILKDLPTTHPHLFSTTPVFVSRKNFSQMEAAVDALEKMIARPAFQQLALQQAPAISGFEPGAYGALMGYDFHLSPNGPKLIEINTNAGGAFLNAALYRAQQLCCATVSNAGIGGGTIADFSKSIIDMFTAEWRAEGHNQQPSTLAIVDTAPKEQYLLPEFILAQKILENAGINTVIADPSVLKLINGDLLFEGTRIDMVYNRLVDFYLKEPAHRNLRDAYLSGSIVLTPNPRHHALYAQKANLQILSSPKILAELGCRADAMAVLSQVVPATERVSADRAEALWNQRKTLFFKPEAGHGGKAVYRGDKLTKNVWKNVVSGPYVAQEAVSPALRITRHGDDTMTYKSDIRLYTYRGKVLLAAARLYRGQTTNFRTPGGGFAPVYVI